MREVTVTFIDNRPEVNLTCNEAKLEDGWLILRWPSSELYINVNEILTINVVKANV